MPRSGAVNDDDTMQFKELLEAGTRHEQSTAEPQRWNLASAHALIGPCARNAEQLGDFGNGVGELVQVILQRWVTEEMRTRRTKRDTKASRRGIC